MIIVDRYKENERTFNEANPGDCFILDDEYFMRTDSVADDINAVNLRTGELVFVSSNTQVEAIRMKAEVY